MFRSNTVRFALYLSVLVQLTGLGEAARMAQAVLYADNTMATFGTLAFTQNDDEGPVLITGIIRGLNVSSAHVRLCTD
jgi:hypothetical protein